MKQTQISDGELSVLRLLWNDGDQSARQIMEQLYPNCSTSDHATVHSLLKRLEKKQLVTRERDRHPHLFTAKISQSEFAGRQLAQMADKVSDGSLAPFLSHLIQADSLSTAQLGELREMLDQHQTANSGRNRKHAKPQASTKKGVGRRNRKKQ